ncbi:serine/threonine protein kinase [Marasmius tenuissimus]|uniref:non-specific serine/threonine protein kinase n=1 Tax=Marasmius tenuissimus TaxID=585030 RepID=A0ABR3AAN7_9AGAR
MHLLTSGRRERMVHARNAVFLHILGFGRCSRGRGHRKDPDGAESGSHRGVAPTDPRLIAASQTHREVQPKEVVTVIAQEYQSGCNSSSSLAHHLNHVEVGIDDLEPTPSQDENVSKEIITPTCHSAWKLCDAPKQSNPLGSASEPNERLDDANVVDNRGGDPTTTCQAAEAARREGDGRAINSRIAGPASVASGDLRSQGTEGTEPAVTNTTKQWIQFLPNARHVTIDGSPNLSNVAGNVTNNFNDHSQHTHNVYVNRPDDSDTPRTSLFVPIPVYVSSPSCDCGPHHLPFLYQSPHEPLPYYSPPSEPTSDPPQYSPAPPEYPTLSPLPHCSDKSITVLNKQSKSTPPGDFSLRFNKEHIGVPLSHLPEAASPVHLRAVSEATQSSLFEKYGRRGRIIVSRPCGVVRVIQDPSKHDGIIYAVKEVYRKHTRKSKSKHREKINAGYCAWKALDHPNIVKTFDLVNEKGRYYEIMEYAPYTLYALAITGKMSRAETYCIFRQICDGVDYLHSRGLTHGDLRLENCLINRDNVVKIIDLGASTTSYRRSRKKGAVGVDVDEDPRKVDIWNVGVMFVRLMLRCPHRLSKLPYDVGKDSSFGTSTTVRWLAKPLGSEASDDVNSALYLLPHETRPALRRMLQSEPRNRCSLSDLLNGRGKGGKHGRIVDGRDSSAKEPDNGAGDPWLKGLVSCSMGNVEPGHVHLRLATVDTGDFWGSFSIVFM